MTAKNECSFWWLKRVSISTPEDTSRFTSWTHTVLLHSSLIGLIYHFSFSYLDFESSIVWLLLLLRAQSSVLQCPPANYNAHGEAMAVVYNMEGYRMKYIFPVRKNLRLTTKTHWMSRMYVWWPARCHHHHHEPSASSQAYLQPTKWSQLRVVLFSPKSSLFLHSFLPNFWQIRAKNPPVLTGILSVRLLIFSCRYLGNILWSYKPKSSRWTRDFDRNPFALRVSIQHFIWFLNKKEWFY